jgi:hypothetical protein
VCRNFHNLEPHCFLFLLDVIRAITSRTPKYVGHVIHVSCIQNFESENQKARNYLENVRLDGRTIFSSTPCPHTPSVYIPPLMSETLFSDSMILLDEFHYFIILFLLVINCSEFCYRRPADSSLSEN